MALGVDNVFDLLGALKVPQRWGPLEFAINVLADPMCFLAGLRGASLYSCRSCLPLKIRQTLPKLPRNITMKRACR